jgi:putative oxidoreductase
MRNRTDSSRTDLALLVLRVVAGVVFVAHGAQKLFVFGFDGTTGAFTQMGVPVPGLLGPLSSFIEFFGGLALLVGLLTRLAALGLVADMLGATLLVHLANGFFNPNGVEFTMTLCAVAATFAIAGAGRYSLDHAIAARRFTR